MVCRKQQYVCSLWTRYTKVTDVARTQFEVQRSQADRIRDQKCVIYVLAHLPVVDEGVRMMEDMTQTANILGAHLPGSEPQFMVS